MKRDTTISPIDIRKIEAIAERVAAPAGLEIVEVELKGSGRSHLLRIYIDRPEGVTHADCELVSREIGAILDEEDPIPGTYELEVSSPGVERSLGKWQHWERFTGRKVKVVLKDPVVILKEPVRKVAEAKQTELKVFDGVITSALNHNVTVQLDSGALVTFPFEQVSRANLKFEW